MRMPRSRRILAVGMTILATAAITVLGPGTADAATPKCDRQHQFQGRYWMDQGLAYPAYYYMPAYYYSSNGGEYVFTCQLRYGNTGNGVKALQESLNECNLRLIGGTRLSVDGQFGNKTFNAVKAVQTAYRIGVDGVYGPQTAQTIAHRAYVPQATASPWRCSAYNA